MAASGVYRHCHRQSMLPVAGQSYRRLRLLTECVVLCTHIQYIDMLITHIHTHTHTYMHTYIHTYLYTLQYRLQPEMGERLQSVLMRSLCGLINPQSWPQYAVDTTSYDNQRRLYVHTYCLPYPICRCVCLHANACITCV
jgi:hypothetical protein